MLVLGQCQLSMVTMGKERAASTKHSGDGHLYDIQILHDLLPLR